MRIKFYNAVGGIMSVDESKATKYKAAGYLPVASVVDSTAKELPIEEESVEKKDSEATELVDKPTKPKRSTRKKKEV